MAIARSESSAGNMVKFKLAAGMHALTEPLRFDDSVLASEISIVGEPGAVIRLPLVSERRRRLSTYNGTNRAAILLSTRLLVQLKDVTFQGSASSFGVAAVVVESGELEMRNCTVRDVQGTRALHARGGTSTILSSLFEANLAGAIVADSGSKLFIGGSALVSNSAANGGALAVTGDQTEVTVVATRIERNSAEVRGGGLYVSAGRVILARGSLVEKNAAPDGAAMYLSGGRTVYALPAPSGRWVNTAVEMEVPSVEPGLKTLVASMLTEHSLQWPPWPPQVVTLWLGLPFTHHTLERGSQTQ